MKIAMIARCDNSGLGNLCWEFVRHLKPTRILIVENGIFMTFPQRYEGTPLRLVPANRSMSLQDQDWLLNGMDMLFSIETFYSGDIVKRAKEKGVKTTLLTMVEMMPEKIHFPPDLFLCPSKLDFNELPEPKVELPVPMNTNRLKWKQRHEAKHFIHTASHGGMNLRKGTPLLLEAIPYIKSDIKITIYSWIPFTCDDQRVEIKMQNFENYWQIWEEGDVLVYPQDYNGICLPICEAFASGLGVLTTDIFPFNLFLPPELLFKPFGYYQTRAAHGLKTMQAAIIDPKVLAQKIDEVAQIDLGRVSQQGRDWALENSWENLLPRYQEVFENLCKT